MGLQLIGMSWPERLRREALSRRRNCGTAAQSDCSTTCSPTRASSTGVGLLRRSSSVCHSAMTSRTIPVTVSSFSSAVRSSESASCSSRAMLQCLCCSARRTICVGCAVSTISMCCARAGVRSQERSESAERASSKSWCGAPGCRWRSGCRPARSPAASGARKCAPANAACLACGRTSPCTRKVGRFGVVRGDCMSDPQPLTRTCAGSPQPRSS